MKKHETDFVVEDQLYMVEYSVHPDNDEPGVPAGDEIEIHAIWINLIHPSFMSGKKNEDIIMLYCDHKQPEHIIDLSRDSYIDVNYFRELVREELENR